MTKIKGPDLVAQWVRQYTPLLIVDDREEVRELVRAMQTECVAYAPEAFINLEG
jgi:hypothetical protein